MKRTYEWTVLSCETISACDIVNTKSGFLVTHVSIRDNVKIDNTHSSFEQALCICGQGNTLWKEFHQGTIWIWQERPL